MFAVQARGKCTSNCNRDHPVPQNSGGGGRGSGPLCGVGGTVKWCRCCSTVWPPLCELPRLRETRWVVTVAVTSAVCPLLPHMQESGVVGLNLGSWGVPTCWERQAYGPCSPSSQDSQAGEDGPPRRPAQGLDGVLF